MAQNATVVFVILLSLLARVCGEQDTHLAVQGNNPPAFVMPGSGSLEFLQVRGPRPQRQVQGPRHLCIGESKQRTPLVF